MNSSNSNKVSTSASHNSFFYGWVIVAAATILITLNSGVYYSFGVFFKPLIADFGWNRATTSGIQSIFLICYGIFSLVGGVLADRFGPAKVAAIGNFVAGLGLILTSHASTLWQFYITYGVITAIGHGANFTICMATATRWFTSRRGLALGIAASGAGLGTFIIVPVIERLIATFGWSTTYTILGVAVWIIMVSSSLLLRRDPEQMGLRAYGAEAPLPEPDAKRKVEVRQDSIDTRSFLWTVIRTKALWTLIATFALFAFCAQMIMTHLINYATDMGVTPLIAATFISVIGLVSIVGRLTMGTASDRIGSNTALITCCLVLAISLFWLLFARQTWMLYIFAIVYGLAYGGEVPQSPSLVAHFFGLRAVSTLVGVVMFGNLIGGALGTWVAGKLFDVTQSYQIAFLVAGVAGIICFLLAMILKRQPPIKNQPSDNVGLADQ